MRLIVRGSSSSPAAWYCSITRQSVIAVGKLTFSLLRSYSTAEYMPFRCTICHQVTYNVLSSFLRAPCVTEIAFDEQLFTTLFVQGVYPLPFYLYVVLTIFVAKNFVSSTMSLLTLSVVNYWSFFILHRSQRLGELCGRREVLYCESSCTRLCDAILKCGIVSLWLQKTALWCIWSRNTIQYVTFALIHVLLCCGFQDLALSTQRFYCSTYNKYNVIKLQEKLFYTFSVFVSSLAFYSNVSCRWEL